MAQVSSVEVVPAFEATTTASASQSAVSWAAILAGAFAAAALSLVLFVLGTGLGLTMVSPWAWEGASATTFAVSTAVWLVVMQWLSSGVGGYVAGRLRTKWSGLNTDESFFRDTVHGFLAWSVATLFVTWLLSSAVASAVSGSASAIGNVAAGAAQGTAQAASTELGDGGASPTDYFVDMMFRPGAAAPAGTFGGAPEAQGDQRSEAARILVTSAASGEVAAPDRTRLAQIVATRTGLSQAEAEQRVDEVLARIETAANQARETADQARQAGMMLAFMTVLSFLIGAFVASAAGAIGGRQRDAY
jgi:hypothetical protein